MRFLILGPLEVWAGERRVSLGGPQQRGLLAMLLLDANRVVSVDRLVARMWGEEPPATARSLLHGCVAQLRRSLRTGSGPGRQRLATRPPGYLLEVEPGELDLHRLDDLEAAANRSLADRTAPGLDRAGMLLREALGLWRGPALSDLATDAFAGDAARLEERRLALVERRIDLDLLLGRQPAVVGELQAWVQAHPLRERLWAQLILALYGADRQADALAAFRQLRETLVEQLAVEPSGSLQQLERAILAGADAVALTREHVGWPPGTARAAPAVSPGGSRGAAGSSPAGAAELSGPPGSPGSGVEPAGLAGPTDRPVGAATPGGPAAETEPVEPATGAGWADRGPAPAQLPAAISAFTGRDRHLADLDALLPAEPATPAAEVVIATIAGTPGVGKTALAVHWAHQVRQRFADGQLYVNLRGAGATPPVRPIEALTGFLHALGVPAEDVPVDLEQAAALYRTLLADRQVLVLLDNAGSAEQVRPLLPGSPGCLVLVTSREQLGPLVARDGARPFALDVLTAAEAEALLTQVLGADRVAVEPEATVALARSCGYLPLALRIAAANLTLRPERTVAEHVAELDAGNRAAAPEPAGDEHAAVRVAFNVSYGIQEAELRRPFRLLGLAPGPDVTAGAAAALTGTTPERAGPLLDRLAEANLLAQHAPGRYTFHDLLRRYAAERAHREETADERAAATRGLLHWYLYTADAAARALYPEVGRLPLPPPDPYLPAAAFADHTQALAWLDAERTNLVAAALYAAEHGPRPTVWLLADALRGYYWLRGYTVDCLTVAEAALAAATTAGERRAQAAAQLGLAGAYLLLAQHRRAIDCYTQALTLSRETDWLQGQAASLSNLGLVLRELGRLEEAAGHYRQALAVDRQTGWLAGQAVKLANLSQVLQELGRLEEAAEHHRQALAVDRKVGSRGGEALDLLVLGETYHALGRLDDALDHLTRALALHRELGDNRSEAETLGSLAVVHCDAGRLPEALDLAATAVALARSAGHRPGEANTLNALATVHQRLGHHAEAVEHHTEALRLARGSRIRYGELAALVGLAVAHRHLAEHDRAREFARQAITLAARSGYRVVEGQAHTVLTGVYLDLRQLDEALEHGRQALDLHRATGHRIGQARTLLLLGQVLHRTGRDDAAIKHLQDAAAEFAGIGMPEAVEARELAGRTATGRPTG